MTECPDFSSHRYYQFLERVNRKIDRVESMPGFCSQKTTLNKGSQKGSSQWHRDEDALYPQRLTV